MQTLEHITQQQLASGLLASGLLRLTPDEGYTLFDGKSHRTFPTADIFADDLPNWSAVAVDAAVEEEPAVEAPVVEEPVEEAPAPKKRSSKKS